MWTVQPPKWKIGGNWVRQLADINLKFGHGSLWLRVGDGNIDDFIERGMIQYTYGKDNSRKLNFYETPAEVLEEADMIIQWATKACEAANRSKR